MYVVLIRPIALVPGKICTKLAVFGTNVEKYSHL